MEDFEIVAHLVGWDISNLQLEIFDGAGREGLVVPATVAEGSGDGVA